MYETLNQANAAVIAEIKKARPRLADVKPPLVLLDPPVGRASPNLPNLGVFLWRLADYQTPVSLPSPPLAPWNAVEAIPAALRYAGLNLADIGWIELNEAFAAQSLAVIDTVGLDRAKVNPMGGAIALGHPLGATGAIRAATVVHALRRHSLKYGMVTMCVGTGQGAAGIFERV